LGILPELWDITSSCATMLLNVLAERTNIGVITGHRFVNGQALPKDFQAQTGYCQQMDTHEPTSSVREATLFSAVLRQPQDVPMVEKEAYTDKCLFMCGLEKYMDAIVATLGVEHRKRLTIAVEPATKPKLLLFLDEPTFGLDSQNTWAIVSFLRTLADNEQAILCTYVSLLNFTV
jgi:ATP-binding cassette, subfamily G (WHITE), member 2, SNQ2